MTITTVIGIALTVNVTITVTYLLDHIVTLKTIYIENTIASVSSC